MAGTPSMSRKMIEEKTRKIAGARYLVQVRGSKEV